MPLFQCDSGFIKLSVYDKDLAIIILGVFWIASFVLHVLQCRYRNRPLGNFRQQIYPLSPRNPDLNNDRVAIVNRLEEEEEEEDDRWNAQWENERCEFRTFLG